MNFSLNTSGCAASGCAGCGGCGGCGGPLIGAFVALFVGLIFGVIGVVMIVAAGDQADEADHIEGLPGVTFAQFSDLGGNVEVAITGTLIENRTLCVDQFGVAQYELVAYKVDVWEVTSDDDGNSGGWETVDQAIPTLIMALDGNPISLYRQNIYASGLRFSGRTYEFVRNDGSGIRATYKGDSLREGSHRIYGFRNGDQVTVVGVRDSAGRVTPERIHGGSKVDLVDDLRDEARTLRIVGYIFAGIGGTVLVITIIVGLVVILGLASLFR